MATRDRPRFFQQALLYFFRQTHENAELVVVDDGQDSVEHLCTHSRVRYIRLDQPTLLGTKMNIGILAARGDMLVKLDDDDYYHPEFLRTALSQLLTCELDQDIVAWDCFLIFFAGDQYARFSGHGYSAGATLCFTRQLWRKQPFRDLPRHVDYWFKEDHGRRIVKVVQPEYFMAVRHGGNTWTSMGDGRPVDLVLRSFPRYPKEMSTLMDPSDVAFYRSLMPSNGPGDGHADFSSAEKAGVSRGGGTPPWMGAG
jgi:glycosyltransferase involved in cell wall biosynthesis